jgi:hypothetical protein
MASLRAPPELAACRWRARGARPGPSPLEGGLEEVLEAYLATRRARFEHHDLDHPVTPLFVDVRGRGLSVHQVKYLIERLYVRAGLRARVPAGALVHALRRPRGPPGRVALGEMLSYNRRFAEIWGLDEDALASRSDDAGPTEMPAFSSGQDRAVADAPRQAGEDRPRGRPWRWLAEMIRIDPPTTRAKGPGASSWGSSSSFPLRWREVSCSTSSVGHHGWGRPLDLGSACRSSPGSIVEEDEMSAIPLLDTATLTTFEIRFASQP